jgi:hypothetical protein
MRMAIASSLRNRFLPLAKSPAAFDEVVIDRHVAPRRIDQRGAHHVDIAHAQDDFVILGRVIGAQVPGFEIHMVQRPVDHAASESALKRGLKLCAQFAQRLRGGRVWQGPQAEDKDKDQEGYQACHRRRFSLLVMCPRGHPSRTTLPNRFFSPSSRSHPRDRAAPGTEL